MYCSVSDEDLLVDIVSVGQGGSLVQTKTCWQTSCVGQGESVVSDEASVHLSRFLGSKMSRNSQRDFLVSRTQERSVKSKNLMAPRGFSQSSP